MKSKNDIVFITDFNGRIGTSLVTRMRDVFDNIVASARSKNESFRRPLWKGAAMVSGPIKVTFAGGKCHVI